MLMICKSSPNLPLTGLKQLACPHPDRLPEGVSKHGSNWIKAIAISKRLPEESWRGVVD
jgi:hypothetical protein